MRIFNCIVVFIAISSLFCFINYRVVSAIKLIVMHEWSRVLSPEELSEKDTTESTMKINGFYKSLDKSENKANLMLIVTIMAWSYLFCYYIIF